VSKRTLALAVLALVACLFGLAISGSRASLEDVGPDHGARSEARRGARDTGRGQRQEPRPTAEPETEAGPAIGARARATWAVTPLDGYLASSVYPPTSRPIAEGDRSLIDYAIRHERPRRAEGAPEHEVVFTADRAWLVGDEARLLVVLAAWGRDGATPPREVRVTLATEDEAPRDLALLPEHELPESVRLEVQAVLARVGRTGPALAAQVTPAGQGLTRPTRLRLDATFTVGGASVQRHLLVPYTPEAAVPARFTGHFEESVEDGSLVIRTGVDVRTPGWYLIDVNLHEVDGKPVAWTRFKGELAAGPNAVPLRFFGKVLRDHAKRSPFELGQLRGALYRPGVEPNLAQLAPFDGRYQTQRYPLERFSDAAWDSPRKQARLAKLADLQADPHSPSVASPPLD
jgi:hypothetical protein